MDATTIILAAFAIMIIVAVARWSGTTWRRVHRAYGVPAWPIPKGTLLGRVKLGPLEFKNMLLFAMDPMGFYLRFPRFLALGIKPLFIPWSAVSKVRRSDNLFAKRVLATIGEPPVTTLELPYKVVQGSKLDPDAVTG